MKPEVLHEPENNVIRLDKHGRSICDQFGLYEVTIDGHWLMGLAIHGQYTSSLDIDK